MVCSFCVRDSHIGGLSIASARSSFVRQPVVKAHLVRRRVYPTLLHSMAPQNAIENLPPDTLAFLLGSRHFEWDGGGPEPHGL